MRSLRDLNPRRTIDVFKYFVKLAGFKCNIKLKNSIFKSHSRENMRPRNTFATSLGTKKFDDDVNRTLYWLGVIFDKTTAVRQADRCGRRRTRYEDDPCNDH